MGLFDTLVRNMMGGHHRGDRHGGGRHGGSREEYGGPSGRTFAGGPACQKCGAGNAADARFCQQCGTSMAPAKCAGCGAQVPVGARFCPQCGKQP